VVPIRLFTESEVKVETMGDKISLNMMSANGKKEPINLYDEVSTTLRAKIFSAVKVGENIKLPTFRALAKELGVSSTTIRQSLKILTDEGLISTRQGSGIYVSDELRQGQKTLAVVYRVASEANIRSPWHSRLLQDINQYIEHRGWITRNYTLYHGTEKRDERVMEQLITDAKNGKFSGMISFAEFDTMKEGFRDLLDSMKIKYLTNDYFDQTNVVIPDYFDLGRLGAEYLYKQGIRKMGLLGVNNTRNDPLRWDQTGFLSVVNSHSDIQVLPEWNQLILPTIGDGYDAFERLWSSPEKPEGLVISDDVLFLGVAMAMNKLGVNCPKDIQLIVQGMEGAIEKCGVDCARICNSTRRNASLMVDQILTMIRDDVATVPIVRISPVIIPEGSDYARGSIVDSSQNHKMLNCQV
jgi:DNA-binding LacI/PurR family transcriptional regulator